MGQTKMCGEKQYVHGDLCCNYCKPGTYLKGFCSETDLSSDCHPCDEGTYRDKYHNIDRCTKCPACPEGALRTENCTKTTKGKCTCRPGFLCSDHSCSSCKKSNISEVNNAQNEELKKCPGNHHFDEKEGTCKPWTNCSEKGLVEIIQGNKTHDSTCAKPEPQGDSRDFLFWSMAVSFVVLSLTLFVFVSYTCLNILWKKSRNRAKNKISIQAVFPKTGDLNLSKEESGLHLIIQEEFKDSPNGSQLDLEKTSSLSSV
ncbi:tumor necrosis factor receptor superfamily member 26-like [Cyprinodon tularosa]|uniref:tumor necrosis factor receptor superfamily member 26-like n=1 Tax=Cyprinodon variegatus TaxID=28743 RepID=UPI0007429485|nr:PREDICTED: tumor necrosis factor receptor superfamily member 26-like [Cyprinodon variegatus]XP_038128931.1 tumor necrosis factor receptor superfamily member 26-like [Cyprinodon tularosa]